MNPTLGHRRKQIHKEQQEGLPVQMWAQSQECGGESSKCSEWTLIKDPHAVRLWIKDVTYFILPNFIDMEAGLSKLSHWVFQNWIKNPEEREGKEENAVLAREALRDEERGKKGRN